MKAIYFAWVRERIGVNEEEIAPPAEVATVGDLVAWLAARGENYAYAFDKPNVIRVAIDRAHAGREARIAGATRDRLLSADDRGLNMGAVRVQREDFDAAHEARALAGGRRDVGALASFVGLCRDEGGRLSALEIEHYPGMAEAEIAAVVAEAEARWPLLGVAVIHRYGNDPAGRADRLCRRRRRPSRRGLRRGGDADGLSQDPRAVLEARAPRRWRGRRLGRGQGERRQAGEAVGRRLSAVVAQACAATLR